MESNRPRSSGRYGADAPTDPLVPGDPIPSPASPDPGATGPTPGTTTPGPTPGLQPGPNAPPTVPGSAPGTSAGTPPAVPPSTQAPPLATAVSAMDDLTAQVAATTTIEASTVALLQGVAAQFTAAAPGNAAVAQLAAQLHASAVALGQAITDCTPFAAPAVSAAQRMMGGTKSSR